MTVLKRPDRKQRPWYYKFRAAGVLYRRDGFASRLAAQEAEAGARLRLTRQKTRTAFSQAVKLRLDAVLVYCRISHYKQSVTRLKQFAAWRDFWLEEITPDLVRARIIELSQIMNPPSVNKHLIALRSVFEQAVNDGLLGRNPCRGLKFLPVARKVHYIPSAEDLQKILALATPLDRAYLTVIWQLAARVREVNQLTWEDVDFGRRCVRLWTRKKRGGSQTPRLVPMSAEAFQALKFAQWHRVAGSPHVFTNPATGRAWDYRSKFFGSLCRRAGIPQRGYHALRNARASALADEGQSLPFIRDFLGHEDISTTSIYLQSLGIKK